MTPDVEALKQQILADIQPQLAAANKTFASQFNPAIGFIVDTVFSSSRKNKSNFEFRSAEIGISANVDPFARAYAHHQRDDRTASRSRRRRIVTTSLPYNLTVKGGRFFADFGRLSTFHDHDLPFVNRPLVLDKYIGGESQADGVEVNWLVPIAAVPDVDGRRLQQDRCRERSRRQRRPARLLESSLTSVGSRRSSTSATRTGSTSGSATPTRLRSSDRGPTTVATCSVSISPIAYTPLGQVRATAASSGAASSS